MPDSEICCDAQVHSLVQVARAARRETGSKLIALSYANASGIGDQAISWEEIFRDAMGTSNALQQQGNPRAQDGHYLWR